MITVPVVAWGDWHTRAAQWLLRSLESPTNKAAKARIVVYTDMPQRFVGREIVKIGSYMRKHDVTSRWFSDALKFGDPICPISADMVASEGLLPAVERAMETCDLLLCPVMRVDAAPFMEEFPGLEPIVLSSRALCRLALKHWHPHQQLQRREHLPSATHPTSIWEQRGETVKARCFHMHPIGVRAPANAKLPGGIDGDYVATVPRGRRRIVGDSDELMVVDMSRLNYRWEKEVTEPVDVVEWARRKTNAAHREFFLNDCYLHAGELEPFEDDGYYDGIVSKLRGA